MLHVIEEPRCDLKIILSHNGAVKFLKEFYGQYTYSTKKKGNNMYTVPRFPLTSFVFRFALRRFCLQPFSCQFNRFVKLLLQ